MFLIVIGDQMYSIGINANPGPLFFKKGFWVGFNSKQPSKTGLLSQKTQKSESLILDGATLTAIWYI